jgi:hypothetical protein
VKIKQLSGTLESKWYKANFGVDNATLDKLHHITVHNPHYRGAAAYDSEMTLWKEKGVLPYNN